MKSINVGYETRIEMKTGAASSKISNDMLIQKSLLTMDLLSYMFINIKVTPQSSPGVT